MLEFQSKKVGEWGTRPLSKKMGDVVSPRPPLPTTPLIISRVTTFFRCFNFSRPFVYMCGGRCADESANQRRPVRSSARSAWPGVAWRLDRRPAVSARLRRHHRARPYVDAPFHCTPLCQRWLGSRVVSVLDSGAEGPGFKAQPRRCRVTV